MTRHTVPATFTRALASDCQRNEIICTIRLQAQNMKQEPAPRAVGVAALSGHETK